MNEFIVYIDELIAKYQAQEAELIQADRKDEANFAKIRINICDICKTLYGASEKIVQAKYGANSGAAKTQGCAFASMGKEIGVAAADAFKEEYLRQLTRLPENWKISYEKAKEHGDSTKIVIEEIKLETLQMIREKFETM